MMNRNYDSYYKRMGKNVEEKTDFIIKELLVGNYNTVIDFGCADGTLTKYLADKFHTINFIGVDFKEVIVKNVEELSTSPIFHQNISGNLKFKTMEELDISFWLSNTMVILSSILHELSVSKFDELLTEKLKFVKAIAIRDMRGDFFFKNVEKVVQEQIMKTLYQDNYECEKQEMYFSINWLELQKRFNVFDFVLVYQDWYMNKYLEKNVPIIMLFLNKTHCKQIYKRKASSQWNEKNY